MTDPLDLEPLVGRELKRLPPPRAPRTLLPRVMAAVARPESMPWYSRPWVAWPPVVRAFSFALVATLGVGLWMLWPSVPQLIADSGSPMANALAAQVRDLTQQFARTAALVRVLWQVLLGPIAMFVLALTVVVALACAAAWTAVSRVALGGASSQ